MAKVKTVQRRKGTPAFFCACGQEYRPSGWKKLRRDTTKGRLLTIHAHDMCVTGPKPKEAGAFVRDEFHRFQAKGGAFNPKQAIAIGLARARKAGVR